MLIDRISQKSFLIGVLFVLSAFILIGTMLSDTADAADEEEPLIRIVFSETDKGELTNDKGQSLKIAENGKLSGNMPVVSKGVYDYGDDDYFVMIDYSKNLTFIPSTGKEKGGVGMDVMFRGRGFDDDYYPGVWFNTDSGVKQVMTIDNERINAYVETLGRKYYKMGIYTQIGYYSHLVEVSGFTSSKVSFDTSPKGVKMTGAKGFIDYYFSITGDEINSDGSMFMFTNDFLFKSQNDKLLPSGNVLIDYYSSNDKNNVKNVYIRPANGGKNMFLTWRMKDKAMSYVIYSKSGKKYKKEAIVNGKKHNYYNIPNAVKNKVYCYKVMAFSYSNGKGKKLCKTAYPVSAVAADSRKANVSSLKLDKKSVTIKTGKSKTIKAILQWSKGKKPLSKKVIWRTKSGSEEIIKLKRKGNKCIITGKKKGTVSIWAKAHNGINSNVLKIKVK